MTDDTDIEVEVAETVTVGRDGDDHRVAGVAKRVASDVGFAETEVEEIGLVGTELAANVLDHAGSGELSVARLTDGDREGVRLESLDTGPGIDDVDAVFADGASTTGSLGGGLGAVNRLMDELTVAAPGEPDYGTHLVADRWRRPEYESTAECPLSFGAASRPKTRGDANGDTFVLKRWDDSALVGVIDGLGHGQPANKAAMAAKGYVEGHYDRPLGSIFEGTERACRGTRGVVMALARFDWVEGTMTVASVGNINHKYAGPEEVSIVPRRGVLGSNSPDPVVTTVDWDPSARLVLFSDGVVSHWDWAEYADHFENSASEAARGLLSRLGKDDDDATVVVVSAADEQ